MKMKKICSALMTMTMVVLGSVLGSCGSSNDEAGAEPIKSLSRQIPQYSFFSLRFAC